MAGSRAEAELANIKAVIKPTEHHGAALLADVELPQTPFL